MSYPPFHPRSSEEPSLSVAPQVIAERFVESQYVERKAGLGARPLRESAVAFANADGGVILIGVEDGGRIRGATLTPDFEDAVHEALRPVVGLPRYELLAVDVEGRTIVVLSVWPLVEGVAQTPDGRVLRRNGTRDDALTGDRLITFVSERATRRHQAEQQPSPWSTDEADSDLVARVEGVRRWQDWRARGLADRVGLTRDGALTVAGALFLRPDPEARLGRVTFEVLRFPDRAGTAYDLRRAFTGPLDEQVTETAKFVQEQLGFELAFRGARRIEIPRIPERVVREVIANAAAHRSYELTGRCCEIELRPDRLVVRSPGGLAGGVTVERLREEQHSRNPVIVEMLRFYDLAEQRGMGIDLIEDEMAEAMLEPPRFADHGQWFEVELPLHSTASVDERAWVHVLTEEGRLRSGDQIVLLHAMRGERLSNGRVRQLLRTDERRARGTLQRLRGEGFLTQRGERAGTTYALDDAFATRLDGGLVTEDVAALAIQLVRERAAIANADLRSAANIDRVQALAVLDRLVAEGRLERTGSRRGTRYRLPLA